MKLATKVAVGVGATATLVGAGALPASATTKNYTFSSQGKDCKWSVQWNLPTASAAGNALIDMNADCLRVDADIYYNYKGQAQHDYIWMPAYPNTYYFTDIPAGAELTRITTTADIAAPGGPVHSGTHYAFD